MNLALFSAAAAPTTPVRFTQAAAGKLPDPHRLQFRGAAAAAATVGAVDSKAGRISGVSLLTADREASGHGLWVDARTLETFRALLEGRRLKAYATHGTWGKDGTLDEVGYWENVRIEGNQLREDFQSLDAWRKHEVAEFDTLFELAEKMPAEFGASLSFSFELVWVSKDGTETPTVRKWRCVGDWDYEMYFVPPAPAEALRVAPSVRATAVYSADFVDVPAANDGLFRAGPVDESTKGTSSPSLTSTHFAMIKELYAKFSGNPAQLSRAIALHTENEKLTFSEIVAKVEGEAKDAELATLRQAGAAYAALQADLDKAGFKAAGEKSALAVLLADHAALKVKADAHDAAQVALKAAGFEGKDGKSATDLALAAHKKLTGDIATLQAGGSVKIDTGVAAAAGQVELKGVRKYEAALAAKLHPQQPAKN